MFPCTQCKTAIPLSTDNRGMAVPCPGCGEQFLIELFPALTASDDAVSGRAVLTPGESSCFYHEGKVAVRSCDYCGRFLCGLCEIAVGEQHLCPMCLAKGKEKTATVESLKSHALHDSIALSVTILSFLFWPLAPVIALVVLFLIFKHYRKKPSLVPRVRWRFWLAGLIALVQFGGFFFFIATMFTR